MKRIKTIAVVLFSALLCFAVTASAGEFSFYDSVNEWIVTAYSEENVGAEGTHSVYLNIRDKEGDAVLPALILLTRTEDNVRQDPETNGDYLVCNCAVSGQISLAYKSAGGLNDIFVMDRHTDDALQEYVKVHNHIKLSGFDMPDPANISANPTFVSFGTVNVGSSSTSYVNVYNTGEAALTLASIDVTGAPFSRDGGTCGASVAGGDSCTIGVKFEPAAAASYPGNLQINSDDDDTPQVNVTLSGTGVQQPTGTSDITFPAFIGMSGPTTIDNGKAFYMTVRVVNNGTQATGAFPLKLYFSLDRTPGSTGDILLGTWNVSNLNPGQTLTYTFYNLVVSGAAIHMNYYVISHADPDNAVGETNEENNEFYRMVSVAR